MKSIINEMMSVNNSVPIVGQGATELLFSDRYAYQVIEVNSNKVILSPIDAKLISGSLLDEHQEYDYSIVNTDIKIELVYRWGSWRKVTRKIVLIDPDNDTGEDIFNLDTLEFELVEGRTKRVYSYPKFDVIFGVLKQYRDPSF